MKAGIVRKRPETAECLFRFVCLTAVHRSPNCKHDTNLLACGGYRHASVCVIGTCNLVPRAVELVCQGSQYLPLPALIPSASDTRLFQGASIVTEYLSTCYCPSWHIMKRHAFVIVDCCDRRLVVGQFGCRQKLGCDLPASLQPPSS